MDHCISTTSRNTPVNLGARIRSLFAVARQRRRLLHVSDRLLDDMGIDRDTAVYEASRPFWDVPKNWRS